jgi:glycosyltransferase involved in cell wall biosynthesis
MTTRDRLANQRAASALLALDRTPKADDAVNVRLYPSVSIIVPAFNEENGVGPQISAIRQIMDSGNFDYEVIVVDDGSKDRTAEAALKAKARVVRHYENKGYGSAIKTGILAAEHDTILIVDADGTYPSREIPNLIALLATADMVVGSRTGSDVHVPWLRRIPKMFLGWLAMRIAGRHIPDLNSGMRAFRRNCVLQYFPVLSNQFSFTTTVTLALLADGYRVVYHPIDYYQRIGKSKIRPWHFMDFSMLVLRMAMLFQPMKIFVPAAFFCIIAGIAKVCLDVVAYFWRTNTFDVSILFQPVLSTSAILLLLVGFQLLLIGMLADGVLRRIAQRNAPLEPSHGVAEMHPADVEAISR